LVWLFIAVAFVYPALFFIIGSELNPKGWFFRFLLVAFSLTSLHTAWRNIAQKDLRNSNVERVKSTANLGRVMLLFGKVSAVLIAFALIFAAHLLLVNNFLFSDKYSPGAIICSSVVAGLILGTNMSVYALVTDFVASRGAGRPSGAWTDAIPLILILLFSIFMCNVFARSVQEFLLFVLVTLLSECGTGSATAVFAHSKSARVHEPLL
jgi:hypothetical protein